jgi:toxin-antitoxin system PIN domain toxin
LIAVDTNLLVYAHRTDSAFHEQAAVCIASLAEGPGRWAIPWPCLHEFLGVVTNPRIFSDATSIATASAAVDAWLESPRVELLRESDTHWSVLRPLMRDAKLKGAQVHDARIAALCLQHGVRELWSADRDFKRFPSLAVRNPLLG